MLSSKITDDTDILMNHVAYVKYVSTSDELVRVKTS
jgi:hypothetical protein